MKCNICKQDISSNDRGTHLVEQHGLTATIAAVIVFLEDRIALAEERIVVRRKGKSIKTIIIV